MTPSPPQNPLPTSKDAPSDYTPLTGHCPCRTVTYTLMAPPLITHCCHCTYCQLETGSAFALNTIIESYNFAITSSAQPLFAHRPSPSAPDGSKHIVAHCPNKECNADLWSYYGGNRASVFVKVGTLGEGARGLCKPGVHIFTGTKVEWVDLGAEKERGVGVFEEFYNYEEVWSKESLERLGRLRKWREEQERNGKAY